MNTKPNLEKPDLLTAVFAEQSLLFAWNENHRTQSQDEGITAKEANTLLKWMVWQNRNVIISTSYHGQNIHSIGKKRASSLLSDSNFVFGKCGTCQGTTGFQAELMGIDNYYHQIRDLDPRSVRSHAFNVVTFPIKDHAGTVTKTPYLVDTTFQQFVNGMDDCGWIDKMAATAKGQKVLHKLLRDGFTPLDNETAQIYVTGQFKGDNKDFDPAILYRHSSENDYNIEEVISYDFDIRTPSMTLAQKPLSAIETQWQKMTEPNYPGSERAIVEMLITNPVWQSHPRHTPKPPTPG